MNSVNLVGNISSDIDLKATQSGKFVAKFSLAVTNPYNRDKTSFIPIEVWGNVAQNTANYCSKGSKISVVGYIEVETWEKDGKKNYRTKVIADKIGFLDSKPKDGASNSAPKKAPKFTADPSSPFIDDPFAGGIDISSGDLPF